MKKHFFVPLLIFNILLLNLSCKKYLEEKSDLALVVPNTLAEFQKLMDDGSTMNLATPCLGASSSDDYFIEANALNSKSPYQLSVYEWLPYPYYYINDWSYAYKALYVPNLCLERLSLVQRTPANAAEWDRVKGSALFFKGYYYLELAWLYAKAYDATTANQDLGIVLREGTDLYKPSVRSTVQESYDAILGYLKQAADLLPDQALAPTRPSKCAAYASLARTYISMRVYDSAAKYADLSWKLTSGLMPYTDASQVSVNASVPFKVFNKETIFYASMNSTVPLYHPTSGPARIDTLLYSSYKASDLRKKAFFTAAGSFFRFKGTYTGSSSRIFSGIGADEILLMRAECFARAGDKTKALSDLNLLLQHRFAAADFVPVVTMNAAETLDSVLLERRKELIFRGSLRWMDVKRLNKASGNITLKRVVKGETFTLPPNDPRSALQIPQDIIETAGIQQN